MGIGNLFQNKKVLIGLIVTIVAVATIYSAWRDEQKVESVKIPENISGSLLFTPYLPSVLPGGFSIDRDSFKMQETALLFTASHKDTGVKLVFSEQGVPKDVDTEAFYSSSVSNPTRLEGLRYKTLFGQLNGRKESLASIITDDDTWILITMPEAATKADVKTIESGLVGQ